jgi:hypothetical protein
MRSLSDNDTHAIRCALDSAARVYQQHAEECRANALKAGDSWVKAPTAEARGQQEGFERLARQFEAQADQAERIALHLAQYDVVVFANDGDVTRHRIPRVVFP